MALGLALFTACDSARVERVEIAAHYVPACAPPVGSTPRQLELIALGDFERSNESVSILASDAASEDVALPEGTRAAELNTLGDSGYWGTGTLNAHNQLSILLWPKNQYCALARRDGAALSARADVRLGASARLETLLMLGAVDTQVGAAASGPASAEPTLFVDLSDATVTELAPDRDLRERRAHASVSELGDRLIVAGGIDPDTGRVRADAEIFDPVLERFDPQPVLLGGPRARHAALNAPFGSSLLIGGESDTGQALGSVEILSTNAPRFSRVLELLATPRVEPRALLLGENRILVGGGFVWSGESNGSDRGYREPVASVEFLSLDLAQVPLESIHLEPAALDRAFVAVGAGGALAVGGCEARGAADCVPCEQGLGCVSRAVWWIDAEGAPHPLEPLPLPLSTAAPKLVPGAGGAPWLLAEEQLGHFDPWLARFEVLDAAGAGARVGVVGEPVALGPGSFAWLRADATGMQAVGFYHSQRSAFTEDVAPLLLGSAQGIVPHRPPAASETGDATLRYSAARGLELSGSAAVVSVADTDYADFTLELSLASGPPPLLELFGTGVHADARASFGGLECPWPDFELPDGSNPATLVRLRVQRAAGLVRLELSSNGKGNSQRAPCQRSLPERVGLRLVGTPGGTSQLTRIFVRRSAE